MAEKCFFLNVIPPLSSGSPCCARFSEDNLWYRGKILERMSNSRFKVRFVDYGNCETVSFKR